MKSIETKKEETNKFNFDKMLIAENNNEKSDFCFSCHIQIVVCVCFSW